MQVGQLQKKAPCAALVCMPDLPSRDKVTLVIYIFQSGIILPQKKINVEFVHGKWGAGVINILKCAEASEAGY